MQALRSRITKGLPHKATMLTCDNSGAKIIQVITVKGHKTVKGRFPAAGVGDLIKAAVKNKFGVNLEEEVIVI